MYYHQNARRNRVQKEARCETEPQFGCTEPSPQLSKANRVPGGMKSIEQLLRVGNGDTRSNSLKKACQNGASVSVFFKNLPSSAGLLPP